uniref:Uncharacterized protein n=1 Tax=Anguilla anguilla TaxID=7936 RepID=A0A0E9VRZ1_ANGAN
MDDFLCNVCLTHLFSENKKNCSQKKKKEKAKQ